MPESFWWALWGASVVATGVLLVWLVYLDSRRERRDTTEVTSLDVLLDRGSQDDATEAELLHWGLIHDITISPLVAARAAVEEHEPVTFEMKQALMAVKVEDQRRRCELVCTDTQRFEAIADEAGFPVSEHGPVEPQRSVWDEDAGVWVKDTARQLPLPLRGLRPIRGAR